MSNRDLMILGIGTLLVLAINFVPTVIASVRGHPDRKLIGQLNILSLLSFLLWLALIVWAAGGARNDTVISRFVGRPGQRGRLVALVAIFVGAGVATTAYGLSRT